jgi:hypothetical protein
VTEEIVVLFRADPESLSKEDLAKIIAALREYCQAIKIDPKAFDPKTGERKQRKSRKRKVDPTQLDIEDLLTGETS